MTESFADSVRATFRRGDSDEVVRRCWAELAQARAVEVEALYNLSRVAIREGELEQAAHIAREALEAAIRSGDRAAQERPRHVLAAVARLSGDLSIARELYRESVRLNEELGRGEAVLGERHNLAFCDLHLGHLASAREIFAANEAAALRNGWTAFLPFAAVADACLAAAEGDHHRAARLIGKADAAFTTIGQVPDPDDAAELDLARTQTTVALGSAAYNEEYARGKAAH